MTGFPRRPNPVSVFEKLQRFHSTRPGSPEKPEPKAIPFDEWLAHQAAYRLTVAQRNAAWREIEELRLRLPGARDGSRSDERTQVVETEEHPDPGPGAEYETTASAGEDETASRAISTGNDLLGYFLRSDPGETTVPEPELREAISVLFTAADRIELLESIVGWVLAGYDLDPVEIEYSDPDVSELIIPFDDVVAELADALPRSLSRADALALRAREVGR